MLMVISPVRSILSLGLGLQNRSQTFQSYIDALMAGDLSRFAKVAGCPGGTGSHVTTFQNNDPDNPALNGTS